MKHHRIGLAWFATIIVAALMACGTSTTEVVERVAADTSDATCGPTDDGGGADAADADDGSDSADAAPPFDAGPDTAYPLGIARAFVLETGQSLGTGYRATAPISIFAYGGNLMRCDPRFLDGGLDAGNWGGLWAMCPAVDLMRLTLSNQPYVPPNNIYGQTTVIPAVDELKWMQDASGSFIVDNAAINGVYLDSLVKGGDSGSYAYGQSAIANTMALTSDAGGYVVAAQLMMHGEADYQDANRNYKARLLQLAHDFAADSMAQTGQAWAPPTVVMQTGGATSSTAGPPLSDLAMLAAADGDPLVVVAGPEYGASEYAGDGLHLTARSEVRLGDKFGEVLNELMHGRAWHPLRITSWSIAGVNVTLHYDVAHPPLRWDELISPPHQAPGDSWSACRGFETYVVTAISDAGVVTRSNESCTGVALGSDGTSVVVTMGHDRSAQDWRVGYATVPDDYYSGTQVPPNRGELCDSDPFVGHYAEPLPNYALHQVIGAGATP